MAERYEMGYFMTPWIDCYDGDGIPSDEEIIEAIDADNPDFIRIAE